MLNLSALPYRGADVPYYLDIDDAEVFTLLGRVRADVEGVVGKYDKQSALFRFDSITHRDFWMELFFINGEWTCKGRDASVRQRCNVEMTVEQYVQHLCVYFDGDLVLAINFAGLPSVPRNDNFSPSNWQTERAACLNL